jgi:hypothetical protein
LLLLGPDCRLLSGSLVLGRLLLLHSLSFSLLLGLLLHLRISLRQLLRLRLTLLLKFLLTRHLRLTLLCKFLLMGPVCRFLGGSLVLGLLLLLQSLSFGVLIGLLLLLLLQVLALENGVGDGRRWRWALRG